MFSILSGRILRPHVLRRFTRQQFQSTLNHKPVKKQTGLKGLMQEYGYSALGVYLGLSFIDLPLCYMLVSFAGEEKIGEYEEKVKQYLGFGKKENEDGGNEENGKHHTSFWTTFAIAYGLHKSLIFIRLPIAAAITPSVVNKLRKMGFNIGNKQLKTIATSAKDSYKEHGLRKSVSTKGVKNIMDNAKSNPVVLPLPPNPKIIDLSTKPDFGTPPTKRQKWWSWFF